jgi:hypothetical protein
MRRFTSGYKLWEWILDKTEENSILKKKLDRCILEYEKNMEMLPSKNSILQKAASSKEKHLKIRKIFKCSIFPWITHIEICDIEYDEMLQMYINRFNIDGFVGYEYMIPT